MRALLAVAAAAAALTAAAPASATSTDSCTDRIAPRACVAFTAETHVTAAVIRMGRYSYGGYTLRCSKGNQPLTIVARGVIRIGRAQTVQVAGPGRVDCTLRSTAQANRRWAHVDVVLFD